MATSRRSIWYVAVIFLVVLCSWLQANARRVRKYNKSAQAQLSGNVNSKKQYIISNADETQSVDLQISIEQTLSNEELGLLELYYSEGFSMEEISDNMNISPNALKVRLHRIRKKLKKYMD